MITWTAAAEQLAEDTREPGFAAASLVASAWQARCLPDATRSLIQAACALTSGDAVQHIWDRVPLCPSADALLTAAEDLEGETAALGRHARDMAAACEAARDQAIAAYGNARRQVLSASTDTIRAGAEQAMREMSQVTGDCEAALDLLAAVLERLEYALRCFLRAPADLAEAYDVPLQFIRDGGTLPWSGDFLTAPGNSPDLITNGARR